MGFQWVDDSDDDGDDGDTGQQPQGRQAQLPNPARQAMRKMEKENTELKKQLAELSTAQRKSSVSEWVKAKGYDPAVAEFVPSSVELTADAVNKWLDERTGLFAKLNTTPETQAPAAQNEQPEGTGELPDEILEALGLINRAATSASLPSKPQDLLGQINDPNLTLDQLNALLRSSGNKNVG